MLRWLLCAVPPDADLSDVEQLVEELNTPYGEVSSIRTVVMYGRDPDAFRHESQKIKAGKQAIICQQYDIFADARSSSARPDVIGPSVFADLMEGRANPDMNFLVNLIGTVMGQPSSDAPVFNTLDGSSDLLDEFLLNQILHAGIEVALVRASFRKPTPKRRSKSHAESS